LDKFRTIVQIAESPEKISYFTRCLFMGSCFADSIGEKMIYHKLPALQNPFGTLFNPASIAGNISLLIRGEAFSPDDLHEYRGLWFSFNHYTGFAHSHPEQCLENINRSFAAASLWLKQSRFLLITWGTAWVYIYKKTAKLVANCHKLPAREFERKLLRPEEIVGMYSELLHELVQYNPDIRVIFTVSPVRHWKDGAVNNQLSKSILLFSIHELLRQHDQTSYFPAYEIFMDELRDYRFYASDMLHPGEQGTNYVWERFCEAYIDRDTKKLMADVSAIMKAIAHRPLLTESPNYKKFIQHTIKKVEQLTNKHPHLDFSKELLQLRDKEQVTGDW
jgi:hypothetical protein